MRWIFKKSAMPHADEQHHLLMVTANAFFKKRTLVLAAVAMSTGSVTYLLEFPAR